MIAPASLPSELLILPQWVVWRLEERDGKPTKVPYQAKTGQRRKAESNDPTTWARFVAAHRYAKAHAWVNGIGFMFSETDPFFGIDLDACRDAETGIVEPWALTILGRFPTYAEWSPSGGGIHIIGRGELPPGRRRTGQIEVYDRLRYFTMTGERVSGQPDEPTECQEALSAWHADVWPPVPAASPVRVAANGSVDLADYELLERIFGSKNGAKIQQLWSGDISGYAVTDNDGESEADLALCNHLIWWTNGDRDRADQLFRQSGLYRPKWERSDYRERTIGKALSDFRGGYTGQRAGYLLPSPPLNRTERATDMADDVPPFPTDTLPPSLRDLVTQAAAALPCPPEFVAVPLLAAAGAAIGNALEIRLKNSWTEGPNLYAVVVGDPGSKKSPAVNVATRPLHAVQAMLGRAYERERQSYEEALDAWQKEDKSARGEKPPAPDYRHVLTTDVTVEALAPMLLGSKGVAILKDELSAWVAGMNQYKSGGRGSDRQHYLSMWSRTGIKVDRKNSPVPVYVPRPCLSVAGAIQPDLVPKLSSEEGLDDGFVDRLLWSYPNSIGDAWTNVDVAETVLETVEVLFKRLYHLEPQRTAYGEDQPRPIKLGYTAAGLWEAWYEAHVAERMSEEFPSILRGAWAKLPGQLARLSLILHAVGECEAGAVPTDEISGTSFASAVRMLDYFKAHGRRVYRRLAGGRQSLEMRILLALREAGELTQREILVDVCQRNEPAERIRALMTIMEEGGLIRKEVRKPKIGRPTTAWIAD